MFIYKAPFKHMANINEYKSTAQCVGLKLEFSWTELGCRVPVGYSQMMPLSTKASRSHGSSDKFLYRFIDLILLFSLYNYRS